MDAVKLHQATAAVRNLFADEEIPENFSYGEQTFEERCEAWVLNAVEELRNELEMCDDEGFEGSDDEDEENEDEGEES